MSLEAISSSFKVANTTSATTKALPLYDMDEVESYSANPISNGYRYTNGTVGYTGDEVIDVTSSKIAKLNQCNVTPDKCSASEYVSYNVKLDIELVTEDSSNSDFPTYEDPIMVKINVRHPMSDYITPTHIKTAIGRAVSVLFPESGSTSRIAGLMKGQTFLSAD